MPEPLSPNRAATRRPVWRSILVGMILAVVWGAAAVVGQFGAWSGGLIWAVVFTLALAGFEATRSRPGSGS